MSRPPRNRETVRRLNLEMSAAVRDALERLRDRIHADSLSEVIRRSLSVYDLLAAEQAKGGELFFRYRDGKEKALVLEFFGDNNAEERVPHRRRRKPGV